MSFAHMTLASSRVQDTARFLEHAFGYTRNPHPGNAPVEVVWLDIGRGQELHVIFVPDFEASPHECEFGRHIAVFAPLADFPAIRARIASAGGEFVDALRTTPYERFFFREPVNGYFFEVIDEVRAASVGR